ncbi:hypothetical protein ACWFRM_03630 [Streptomyces sp. NPDC055144]
MTPLSDHPHARRSPVLPGAGPRSASAAAPVRPSGAIGAPGFRRAAALLHRPAEAEALSGHKVRDPRATLSPHLTPAPPRLPEAPRRPL